MLFDSLSLSIRFIHVALKAMRDTTLEPTSIERVLWTLFVPQLNVVSSRTEIKLLD
jgi:hypothetical protein